MTESSGVSFHPMLGVSLDSPNLSTFLSQNNLNSTTSPDYKIYSDIVYLNYYELGFSLNFEPAPNYKLSSSTLPEQLQKPNLKLISIDIYNHEAKLDNQKPSLKSFWTFPSYPILVDYQTNTDDQNIMSILEITAETKGNQFTQILGEPDRKGGGEGSMGIWCEWVSNGIMVEFASGGLQAWEKGAESVWKTITIFEKGVSIGKDLE